jgi:hypothetical protein
MLVAISSTCRATPSRRWQPGLARARWICLTARLVKVAHRQQLLATLALALLVVLAALASAATSANAAEAPTYNMAGTWTTGYANGSEREEQNGTWDITTMDMATGAFSGTAEIEGEKFTLTGEESGATVHQELVLEGSGYSSQDVYTLSVLSSGHVGTNNGTFAGGSREFWAELGSEETGKKAEEESEKKAKEEAEKKAKEEAEKSAKRPSSTIVTCNYEFATSENTCVAVVGDAGSGTPVTPTGSVTFTTTSGGFTSGATCSLAPTSGSPSVANCTLVYFTMNSGLPTITATYGGDARHTGSSGNTQFLGIGTEGSYETPTGPSGEYPNEVILDTEVPINGTAVEGSVQSPDPNPAPVPMALPTLTGLDPTSAADLKLTETDATKVDDSGAQNAKDLKELNESIEKLDARTTEVSKSTSSAEQAEVARLQKDTTDAIEAARKMLKKQEEVELEISRNIGTGSAFESRKSAKKPKTKSIKPLAYVVKSNVAAGKLKLSLRINRKALDKLAGKHSSVTVLLRVDMVLPSELYEGGVPRSFIDAVKLERAPKHKK